MRVAGCWLLGNARKHIIIAGADGSIRLFFTFVLMIVGTRMRCRRSTDTYSDRKWFNNKNGIYSAAPTSDVIQCAAQIKVLKQ